MSCVAGTLAGMTSATPFIDDQRLLRLSGAHNVRDLGGYRSTFGGTVRWGRIYRAGRLDELTAADVEQLRAIDLSVIYDLRTDGERSLAPDVVPSVHVPLLAEELMRSATPPIGDREAGEAFLAEMTMAMLRGAGSQISAIVFTLADPSRMPMMFHCTAGKDRTGLVAALILELLGVGRDDVLDDYELSAVLHRPSDIRSMLEQFAGRGVPAEVAAGMMAAPRSVMRDVLRFVDAEYGGVERYLANQGGLDRGAVETIRNSLLV